MCTGTRLQIIDIVQINGLGVLFNFNGISFNSLHLILIQHVSLIDLVPNL